VAMNPNTGDFVATWSSRDQSGNGSNVYAQRYNAVGAPQGGPFQVSTPVFGANQQDASVAMGPSGDFVITWSGNQLLGTWNVYEQRYNAAGTLQGLPDRVNPIALADQAYSTVAMDAAGDF